MMNVSTYAVTATGAAKWESHPYQNDECQRQCSHWRHQMIRITPRRWIHNPRVNQHQISNTEAWDLVGNKLSTQRFGILPGVWEHCTKIIPTFVARSSTTAFLMGISAWWVAFGRLRVFWSLHCWGVLGPCIGSLSNSHYHFIIKLFRALHPVHDRQC